MGTNNIKSTLIYRSVTYCESEYRGIIFHNKIFAAFFELPFVTSIKLDKAIRYKMALYCIDSKEITRAIVQALQQTVG